MRACAIVPTYDNALTVRGVVERIRSHDLDVIVIDDGSATTGRRECEQIAADGLATVLHLPQNSGKGAACKRGFSKAQELGYTHAVQVDADGQHDIDQLPNFLAAALESPEALVLAYPLYDETAPRARRIARSLMTFWVALEIGSRTKIRDAMIGFRVYPLATVKRLPAIGNGMDFDIEIAVRLVRAGCTTINLPIKVRYLTADAGGVSHFRPIRDNLRFVWMHSKLCTTGCIGWLLRILWPFKRQTVTAR